jgi:type II secretion system (T2SS) protein E
VPKTLGEIAIEAGLVNKASAAKAGRLAEERKLPLVVVLVRELGVDEVALVGALRKQTRVPLIDPGSLHIDPEALRHVPRDVCARLRVLPMSVARDGNGKVMRIAMADPTDTAAVAEIEQLTHCDVEVNALPLSAIDELVERGYRQVNTAVVSRAGNAGAAVVVASRGRPPEAESEVSVTAQMPVAMLYAMAPDDLETRLTALVNALVAKGLVTEAELAEALRKLKA